jgi:glucose-6-phosphate isomerase
MWSGRAKEGISHSEWKRAASRLTKAHEAVERVRAKQEQGFFDAPFDAEGVRAITRAATKLRRSFRHLIVIGIGGSDLGARAILQALPQTKMRVHFASNPDPLTIASWKTLTRRDWKATALLVISKSGSTLETLSIFFTLRGWLMSAVGGKAHSKHVFVITDPTDNPLHALAKKEGYRVLAHPQNIGGRFSVLSVVGLLPAACAGVQIEKLVSGARALERMRRQSGAKSLPAQFALHHALAYEKHGKSIHVLMPYADRLSGLAFWYRQLWAESLGKREGSVHVGPTPVAALGAVDQHSQIQLYNDGPNDKVVTFLEVDHFTTQVKVPRLGKGLEAFSNMSGVSFERMLHAERQGTAEALAQNGRPNGTVHLSQISPESIGAFFHHYMCATAYVAELLGINAYNQPGVEAGKKAAKKLLESKAA